MEDKNVEIDKNLPYPPNGAPPPRDEGFLENSSG